MRPFVYSGPNAVLVSEVAEFAVNAKLLFATLCPPDLDVLVTSAIPADGFDAGLNGVMQHEIPSNQLTYRDMREYYMSDILATLKQFPRIDSYITNWYVGDTSVYQAIRARIAFQCTYDPANWILCDLCDISLARAAYGLRTHYERLFDVYKAGGWPVGWAEKEMPQGRPMAIFPSNMPLE